MADRNEVVSAAIADALKQEDAQKGAAPAGAAGAQVPAKAEEKPAEPKKSVEDKSFERLTKLSAEVRAKGEKYKHLEQLETKLPPGALAALVKARLANDTPGVLAALGLTYADVVEQQLEEKPAAKKPAATGEEPEEKELDPRVAAALKEVEELKAERDATKAAAAEKEARDSIATILKGKFGRIEATGRIGAVGDYLRDFYNRTGGMAPGETWEESVELAAIAVDKNLESEEAAWRKYFAEKDGKKLDKPGETPTVGGEAKSDASAGVGVPGKTLTNDMTVTSGSKMDSTLADILKKLENDPRAWG